MRRLMSSRFTCPGTMERRMEASCPPAPRTSNAPIRKSMLDENGCVGAGANICSDHSAPAFGDVDAPSANPVRLDNDSLSTSSEPLSARRPPPAGRARRSAPETPEPSTFPERALNSSRPSRRSVLALKSIGAAPVRSGAASPSVRNKGPESAARTRALPTLLKCSPCVFRRPSKAIPEPATSPDMLRP